MDGGLDFRNNTVPVTNQNRSYSTFLFTKEFERIIAQHDSDQEPFFIYAAYQSVHFPLETPNSYINDPECRSIPFNNHSIFCGMLQAADEGIAKITMRLKEKNLLDNTIIIFTTANGGQMEFCGNNLPLRGNKNTVYERGVHGTGFVWGSKLPKVKYN